MGRKEVENMIKATEPTDADCALMEKQEAEIKRARAKVEKAKKARAKAEKEKAKVEKAEKVKPEKKEKDEKVKKLCGGKTKAGVACKRSAMKEGKYCAAHKK